MAEKGERPESKFTQNKNAKQATYERMGKPGSLYGMDPHKKAPK